MSAQRWLLGIVGVGVLIGGAAALVARRFAPTPQDSSPAASLEEQLDELAPDSTVFEPAPLSESNWTVRTQERAPRRSSADDLESFGSDELGFAYLSRATEQGSFEEDALDAELIGFQIHEPG
jgi:hypothetical protein